MGQTMRNRKNKTRRANVSKRRGTSHTQTFFVYSPTSGVTDMSVVSGVTVADGEKLPRKPRINTNANVQHGGASMYPKLREGWGY
jgi:hypothetical protein